MNRGTTLLVLLAVALGTAGCEAIATIFEAGVWVGVIVAVLILAAVVGLVRMVGGGRRR